MTDTIIAAIIGAAATVLVAVPAWWFEHTKRRNAENAAKREKAEALQERELNALQQVIDMSNDIHVLDNPSMISLPQYGFERVGELRVTILKALGALPRDSQARPKLETMQDVAWDLRQNYRNLVRPVGEPEPVNVTPEDFESYVQAFRDRFAPLLHDLENRVQSAAPDPIQST